MSLKSSRSSLTRLPSRGHYDKETLYRILDDNFLCHVAFAIDGSPFIIPTAYGRLGDNIYLHGSAKSHMLNHLIDGGEACISVMQVDGIVLARSLFHSSMNYHSVVIFGKATEVTDHSEKMDALRIVSNAIWPNRWDEARHPNPGEMAATAVVRIPVTEGSAKIRTGPAKDNQEDYALDIWAGVVPVVTSYGTPIPDELLDEGTSLPPSLLNL